jgi:hypothetical protein
MFGPTTIFALGTYVSRSNGKPNIWNALVPFAGSVKTLSLGVFSADFTSNGEGTQIKVKFEESLDGLNWISIGSTTTITSGSNSPYIMIHLTSDFAAMLRVVLEVEEAGTQDTQESVTLEVRASGKPF